MGTDKSIAKTRTGERGISVGVAEQIITRIDRGEDPKQVANQVSWSSVPHPEREKLFHEAEQRSGQGDKSHALIMALYWMVNRANDKWDLLRALALLIRRPDLPIERKQKGLEVVRKELDTIGAKLDRRDQRSIQRFKLYEADYHALRAQVTQEAAAENWLPMAIQCYSHARDIWERYGDADRASWARQQVEVLQGILERKETLLPFDLLRSERSTLQAEIEGLRRQEKKLQETLTAARESEQQVSARVAQLASEAQTSEAELKRIQGEVAASRDALLDLQEKIREYEVTLHWLMALPRAAMAPLWIEVVRMGLAQGEIDELTQQAIDRLVPAFPAEAFPLLAEIAARAPEPFKVDPDVLQDAVAGLMSGIARARIWMPADIRAAAQCLVDSWTAFFASISEITSDA